MANIKKKLKVTAQARMRRAGSDTWEDISVKEVKRKPSLWERAKNIITKRS